MGSWPPILGGCRSPDHLRRVARRGAAEKVTPALSAAGSPDPPGPARLEPDERTLRRIFQAHRADRPGRGGIGAAGVLPSEASRRNELRTRNALNGPRIGSDARGAKRRASARRLRSHAIRVRRSCRHWTGTWS